MKSVALGSVCALFVSASASANFIGGGIVSQASWNSAASTAYGTSVTVWRLYAAFSGTTSTSDTVNSVFNANWTTSSAMQQVGAPFGGNFAPNSGFFGFEPKLQWDTYVSIGQLTDTTTVGADGNGVNFGATSLGPNSGWFNSNPPNLMGRAALDTTFGTGLNIVFLAQITVLGGGVGNVALFNTDGTINGGTVLTGNMGLGINSQTGSSIPGIQIVEVPTPGAVALAGLAGLTTLRRRRSA